MQKHTVSNTDMLNDHDEHEHEHDHDCACEEHDELESAIPYQRDTPKIGRNDPCPCHSGKKYKKCCL